MRNTTHIGSNKRNRRHKSHSHGRHHPPRPHHPPPPPHRAERQMQVEAGMCRNTGKHRKQRCEMQRSTRFAQCSVQPGGWDTFAIQQRKNRCDSRSKVKFWVRNVPKLEIQHMPAKESHHPARRQTQRLPTTTTTTAAKINNTSD